MIRSLLSSLVIATVLLCLPTASRAQVVETDTVCTDPMGAFEIATKLSTDGRVPIGTFLMYCKKIPVTSFEFDPQHPQLLAAGKKLYGIFKVVHDKNTKYAIVKIG